MIRSEVRLRPTSSVPLGPRQAPTNFSTPHFHHFPNSPHPRYPEEKTVGKLLPNTVDAIAKPGKITYRLFSNSFRFLSCLTFVSGLGFQRRARIVIVFGARTSNTPQHLGLCPLPPGVRRHIRVRSAIVRLKYHRSRRATRYLFTLQITGILPLPRQKDVSKSQLDVCGLA